MVPLSKNADGSGFKKPNEAMQMQQGMDQQRATIEVPDRSQEQIVEPPHYCVSPKM